MVNECKEANPTHDLNHRVKVCSIFMHVVWVESYDGVHIFIFLKFPRINNSSSQLFLSHLIDDEVRGQVQVEFQSTPIEESNRWRSPRMKTILGVGTDAYIYTHEYILLRTYYLCII